MKSTFDGGPATAPSVQDLLDSPLAGRKFDRELEVCESIRRVLSFCRYRRAPEHYCYARPSSRPDVLGLRRGISSFFAVDLAHPLRWHEEVYRRGLSGVSGCFVFEPVAELEGRACVVLAARQGRGCSLRLAYALARPGRGTWRLELGSLPAAYRTPPAAPARPMTTTTAWRCGAVSVRACCETGRVPPHSSSSGLFTARPPL